jgi:MFS family permease
MPTKLHIPVRSFRAHGPLYSTFVWFVTGSVIFARAQSMAVLIICRIFQGVSAAGIDVLGEIILADMTSLQERPKYLGLVSIPMGVGIVVGPWLGAAFTEGVRWRWLGCFNIPVSAFNLALILGYLRLKPIEHTLRDKLKHLDWIGMVLFAIGTTAFASPLSWAGAMFPWRS